HRPPRLLAPQQSAGHLLREVRGPAATGAESGAAPEAVPGGADGAIDDDVQLGFGLDAHVSHSAPVRAEDDRGDTLEGGSRPVTVDDQPLPAVEGGVGKPAAVSTEHAWLDLLERRAGLVVEDGLPDGSLAAPVGEAAAVGTEDHRPFADPITLCFCMPVLDHPFADDSGILPPLNASQPRPFPSQELC